MIKTIFAINKGLNWLGYSLSRYIYQQMFSQMGWEQVGALAEDTQDFPAYHVTLQDYLKLHGINMLVKQNVKAVSSHTDFTKVIHVIDEMLHWIYFYYGIWYIRFA